MITLVNLKKTPDAYYDLYIGRENSYRNLSASKWANPFWMRNESARLDVVSKYYNYIVNELDLLASLSELDDRVLACWCYPKLCHGHILRYLRSKQLINLPFAKTFNEELVYIL